MSLLALTETGRWFMYIGAGCFGLVVGWFTYFVMRRSETKDIKDIGTLIGAIGGGAILDLYDKSGPLFGIYAIGLLAGAVLYLVVFWKLVGKDKMAEWITSGKANAPLGGDRNP
jgi:hypothetical protein